VDVAKAVGTAFDRISTNVEQVSGIMAKLARNAETATTDSESVRRGMQRVDEVTKSTIAIAEGSAGTAHELTAQAEAVAGMVVELMTAITGRVPQTRSD
jgi:methyl-accepting chemotaxis protein